MSTQGFPEAASGFEPKTLQVHELKPEQASWWDAFVERCPQATFFHRAGWRTAIETVFGHKTYYLYAEVKGEIQGVLPLGHIRSRLFGNALLSTPFCVYGGIAAMTEAARSALDSAASTLAVELRVDYLELRNRARNHPDWPVKDLYVTFRKKIQDDEEQNLLAIPRKQRRMVRQGIKAGLASHLDSNIDRFYEIYAVSVRNLGTPIFPKMYFRMLKDVFGSDCEVLTVTLGDRPVSSVMVFYFRDEVLPYYAGSVSEGRRLAANDFMYWELMRRACRRGCRLFDYGRSKKGTGSYEFKKNWGFEPEPLSYEYLLLQGKAMPDVSPMNPRYRMFITIWKRIPVPITKLIGPVIARNLA